MKMRSIVCILYLLAENSSCSAELTMKKVYNLGSTSRKHAYINLTTLNPTFIQGLQGYTIFFLFQLKT